MFHHAATYHLILVLIRITIWIEEFLTQLSPLRDNGSCKNEYCAISIISFVSLA